MIQNLNGNILKYYRAIIVIIITALLSVGGWVFSEVRDMPVILNDYARVVEVKEVKKELDCRITTLQTATNKKLDAIHAEVGELNIFLRNHYSQKD